MLKFIKSQSCPKCHSQLVKQSLKLGWDGKAVRHMNGQPHEVAEFECGQVVEWIPNFGKETLGEYSRCAKDPKVIKARKALDGLIDRMVAMIKDEDGVDADTKNNLIQTFSYKRSRS